MTREETVMEVMTKGEMTTEETVKEMQEEMTTELVMIEETVTEDLTTEEMGEKPKTALRDASKQSVRR